jgi:hypothetical protein
MAIGVIEEFTGPDLALYDIVTAAMKFPQEWPDGMIYHAAGAVEGGIRIVEQWEGIPQYETFVRDKLRPALIAVLGERAETVVPKITTFDVHNAQHAFAKG